MTAGDDGGVDAASGKELRWEEEEDNELEVSVEEVCLCWLTMTVQ